MIANLSTGCSKRPSSEAAGESKPEAYPQGYVEDFDEPRTKLAGFFSILISVSAGLRPSPHPRLLRDRLDAYRQRMESLSNSLARTL